MSTNTVVTYNMDVLVIVRLLNRFIEEVSRSQSAGTTQATSADVTRLLSYTAATRTFVNHVINQPVLDLPETHPRTIDLPSLSEIPDMENDAFFAAAMLLETARDELIKSASTRLSSNLVPFDTTRLTAIIDKCDALVTQYIQVSTPIDLPESSPRSAMPPAGR
jgi:hypothetical protein